MNDRELLELAAKAAGIKGEWAEWHQTYGDILIDGINTGGQLLWNPLVDDGDALRLAAKLSMSVDVSDHEESTYAYAGKSPRVYAMEMWRRDKDGATRRAVVRAAAEIGRSMT